MAYDAHCHLDFAHTPAGAVGRARAAGVTGFCLAGAEPEHWGRLRQTARAIGAHTALGLHPWFLPDSLEPWLEQLGDLLGAPDVDALGELGLDHVRATTEADRAHQVDAFRAQLALARERNVPIVLHSVRTDAEVLGILEADGVPPAGGLLHAFTGGPDHARAFGSLGLCLSFGLRGLRRDASALPTRRSAAAFASVPEDRRLFETDAPDVQVDGRPAEPADVLRVAAAHARALGDDPAHLLARAEENARRLFPRSVRSEPAIPPTSTADIGDTGGQRS
jgi:TatD DNase family protein